jgi:hypothetical protein
MEREGDSSRPIGKLFRVGPCLIGEGGNREGRKKRRKWKKRKRS